MDCAICLQQITSKTVSAWSCKHMFHENCALNWKTTQCNATCPCCRALQRNSTSKFAEHSKEIQQANLHFKLE